MDKLTVKDEFSMKVFKIVNGKKQLIETYSDKNKMPNLKNQLKIYFEENK